MEFSKETDSMLSPSNSKAPSTLPIKFMEENGISYLRVHKKTLTRVMFSKVFIVSSSPHKSEIPL